MSSLLDKLIGRPHHSKNDSTHTTTSSNTTNSNLNAYATPTDNSMGGILGNNRSGYNSGAHNTTTGLMNNRSHLNSGTGFTGANNTYVDNNMSSNPTLDSTMHDENVVASGHGAVVTRSEERLAVGKETVDTGSVALNKYVTTEHVEKSVPIVREHVTIEREPITTTDAASINPIISEERIQVDTTAERAVAMKETVPIEKIRLNKVREQTEDVVEADLRKEHVDVVNNTNEKILGASGLSTEKSLNNSLGNNSLNRNTNAIGSDYDRRSLS